MTRKAPQGPRRPSARIGLTGGTAISIAIAVAGLAAWYLNRGDESPRADATDIELVTLGATVYNAHCASCHGGNLEGEPNWRLRRADGTLPAPPHDATGHTWHHSDEQLFRMTKEGPAAVVGRGYRSAMPGFAGVLENREIWASLAYIKSRWPANVREVQAKIDASTRN